MTIGNRLRKWRKENNLTTIDLKESTGISTGAISNYENDKREISSNFLLSIKKIYNADILYILTGVKKDENVLTENEKELLEIFEKFTLNEQREIIGLVRREYREYKKERDEKLIEGQGKSSTSRVG